MLQKLNFKPGFNKQGLFLYYEGAFYDISPLDDQVSGTATFNTVQGSANVTVNLTSHGLEAGRYITFNTMSVIPNGFTSSTTFTEGAFEIRNVTSNSFDITTPTVAVNPGGSSTGSATVQPYEVVGPTFQTAGYGWGTYQWNTGTWGTARTISDVTLDPGLWSLDNFGEILVATVHNGKTFTWNAGATNARTIRASTATTGASTSANPTKSIMTLVSDRDRHLFHLGTETTIGDTGTQDPMFIRFSNQENLNEYAPTATNTAGTFRLDAGSEIRAAVNAKDYTLVLTDQAAYTIQFVGPPFTFSIRQVGTGCGCIGQNAIVYADGAVYWMGDAGGFFVFDGTVKSLPCLVEDFVFTTDGNNLGLNFGATETIAAGYNSLYDEVMWFYPKSGSTQIDRVVTYNYAENVWTTGSLARTTYVDAYVFDNPYATEYSATGTPNFPIQGITNRFGATTYYSHEDGTDQVANGTTTAIPAFITSGDLDIDDGEIFSSIRRFVPDYKYITGNSKVTLFINDYPNNTQRSSPLGPFTVTSTTDKVDTRARGRLIAVKIENDSTGETWRYGTLRVDAQPDGRR